MNTNNPLPKLITFDGEARSGKGTVVQATKDYLRDYEGRNTMLIDAGQVFRVLVVAVSRAAIDVDDAAALDAFLADEINVRESVQLVKDVYRMSKDERDALLYTNEIGVNSAKVGARPLSQSFKDDLLRKWLGDARDEGFEVVLLDGRTLEEVGTMLESAGLCEFTMGLYFVCESAMGARRTLGFASRSLDELKGDEIAKVDELVTQIDERNDKDRLRDVQPIHRPMGAPVWELPDEPPVSSGDRPMYVVDTSADMTREAMSAPVAREVARVLSVTD